VAAASTAAVDVNAAKDEKVPVILAVRRYGTRGKGNGRAVAGQ